MSRRLGFGGGLLSSSYAAAISIIVIASSIGIVRRYLLSDNRGVYNDHDKAADDEHGQDSLAAGGGTAEGGGGARGVKGVATKVQKTSHAFGAAYLSLIGNTPLVLLPKLSSLLRREIWVKMESLNPGGTGKDRAAFYMVTDLLAKKANICNSSNSNSSSSSSNISSNNSSNSSSISSSHSVPIVEGTSGSTGIALASICNALGLPLYVVMPDDQATEKRRILETLGAIVKVVPSCAISNKDHYVNQARNLAKELDGIFVDQFENDANFKAHFETTGPEIFSQMAANGKTIDAFVMSSGTGGTIAGVSNYLKSKDSRIKIVLADPQGSSLHRKVKFGVCYTPQQAERTVRKHRYDSIVEGVGLDRLTNNFKKAIIDDSHQSSDQEIVDLAHWLLNHEGMFVGSSSALNVSVAIKAALALPESSVVVTVICDSGQRHLSRLWSKDYVASYDIRWPESPKDVIPNILRGL